MGGVGSVPGHLSTIARLVDAVVVLHTFQKKTQATSKQDLAIAKERFAQLMRERR